MQHGAESTEEILGIIKRVIERENRETAADEKRKRETIGFAPALTPALTPAVTPAEPFELAEVPLVANDAGEVLDLGDADLVLVEDDAPAEAAAPVDEAAGDAEPAEPAALTGTEARQSVNDSFAALAMLARSAGDPDTGPAESPLEGMVREMLRPMLAEWLDANLPPIVEKLVREEIDRIAGKSR